MQFSCSDIVQGIINVIKFSFCLSGVCLGLQCAIIEFARNVLNLPAADSTEFNPDTPDPVVSGRTF